MTEEQIERGYRIGSVTIHQRNVLALYYVIGIVEGGHLHMARFQFFKTINEYAKFNRV